MSRRKIGRFILGKTLDDRGPFGKVKSGWDTVNNHAVTVRVLDKAMVASNGIGPSLKREVGIMKLVRHKNVVKLMEVLASNAKIYIVLERIGGGELFDKIVSEGRVSEDVARRYFSQLIDGVEHCHQKGVAHRDLKPEILLLDDDGNLKISDFGLSALYNAESQEGLRLLHTTCGTPNYVAPEVLSDQGYDGRKADIWSCGVILYVLLAGFLPFDEPTMSELFRKVQNADFSYPRWFSPSARSLIDSILVANPSARPNFREIRRHAWMAVKGCEAAERSCGPTNYSSQSSFGPAEGRRSGGGGGIGGPAAAGRRQRPTPVIAASEADYNGPVAQASPLSIEGAVSVQEYELADSDPTADVSDGDDVVGCQRLPLPQWPLPERQLAAVEQRGAGCISEIAPAQGGRFSSLSSVCAAETAPASVLAGPAAAATRAAAATSSSLASLQRVESQLGAHFEFYLGLGLVEAQAAVAAALKELGCEYRVLSNGRKIKACYAAGERLAGAGTAAAAAGIVGLVVHVKDGEKPAHGAEAVTESDERCAGSVNVLTHVEVKLAAGSSTHFKRFCDALTRKTSLSAMVRRKVD